MVKRYKVVTTNKCATIQAQETGREVTLSAPDPAAMGANAILKELDLFGAHIAGEAIITCGGCGTLGVAGSREGDLD